MIDRVAIRMQKEPRSSWMFILPAIHRYYPDVWSVCKMKPVVPECSSFLPFTDTTLMYDPCSEILPWCMICMQNETRSSWMFIIPAVHRYYPGVWSMFRDTTLMYDLYAKWNPFFLNVHQYCHSEILYPDVRSLCRDNTLMYNLYSKSKKEHRSSLL